MLAFLARDTRYLPNTTDLCVMCTHEAAHYFIPILAQIKCFTFYPHRSRHEFASINLFSLIEIETAKVKLNPAERGLNPERM